MAISCDSINSITCTVICITTLSVLYAVPHLLYTTWINHEIKKDMKTQKPLYNTKRIHKETGLNAYKGIKNFINIEQAPIITTIWCLIWWKQKTVLEVYIKAKRKDTDVISTIMHS